MKYHYAALSAIFLSACDSNININESHESSQNSIATPLSSISAEPQKIHPIYAKAFPERHDYPASNTINEILNNDFMTTDSLNYGDIISIAYQMPSAREINEFQFYTILDIQEPSIGDWALRYSQDSSDGSDGTWVQIDNKDYSYSASQAFGDLKFSAISAKWIQLRMQYNGRGAYGPAPQFYLKEIYFYGK